MAFDPELEPSPPIRVEMLDETRGFSTGEGQKLHRQTTGEGVVSFANEILRQSDATALVDRMSERAPIRRVQIAHTPAFFAHMALREAGHDHVPLRHQAAFLRGISHVAGLTGLPIGRILTPIRAEK